MATEVQPRAEEDERWTKGFGEGEGGGGGKGVVGDDGGVADLNLLSHNRHNGISSQTFIPSRKDGGTPPSNLNQQHRPSSQHHYRHDQRPYNSFTTAQPHSHPQPQIFEQTGEILLLAVIIGMWFTAIAVFLHRWRSIRIVRAPETRLASYRPKNLDAVKVVAKHRDSVIYKNLPENMSRTLEARQNRLNKMNTVPNIKIGEQLQQLLPQPQSLLFAPMLLQQQQKEQPVYCFGRPQSLPQLQQFLQQQLLQQLQLLQQTQQTNFQHLLTQQEQEESSPQPQQTVVSFEKSTKFSASTEQLRGLCPSQLEQHDHTATIEPCHDLQTAHDMDDGVTQIDTTSPPVTTTASDTTQNNNHSHISPNLSTRCLSLDEECCKTETIASVHTNPSPTVSQENVFSKFPSETEVKAQNPHEDQKNLPSEKEFLLGASKFQAKPKQILKSKTRMVLQPLLSLTVSEKLDEKSLGKPLKSILKRNSTRHSFMPISGNSQQ